MAARRFAKYAGALRGAAGAGVGAGADGRSSSTHAPRTTLRRARSEELMSEVGVDGDENNNGNNANNGSVKKKRSFDDGVEILPDFFAAKLRKRSNRRTTEEEEEEGEEEGHHHSQLQVSDTPMSVDTSNYVLGRRRVRRNSAGDEISSILDNGLAPAPAPAAESELERRMAQLSLARPGCFDPYGKVDRGEEENELDRTTASTATAASSSLNTTVVTKLEVTDR